MPLYPSDGFVNPAKICTYALPVAYTISGLTKPLKMTYFRCCGNNSDNACLWPYMASMCFTANVSNRFTVVSQARGGIPQQAEQRPLAYNRASWHPHPLFGFPLSVLFCIKYRIILADRYSDVWLQSVSQYLNERLPNSETLCVVTRDQRVNTFFSPEDAGKYPMMTSSNGNIFRVTGHLCGEFTGPRWIPHTKDSDAELWCFLWSASE